MTCEEFQELAAAYALGALDGDEQAAADAHLAEPTHRGCEEELRRAYATVAALASGMPPVAPGDGVWRAIEARIGPTTGTTPMPRAIDRRGRRRSPAWVGWAAAAAAIVLVVLWFGERRNAEKARDELALARGQAEQASSARATLERELATMRATVEAQQQVVAVLNAPGSRVVALDPVSGHLGRATAVLNVRTRQAVIVSGSLPPVSDKTYQLWVIRGTAAPSPAGFLKQSGGLLVGQVDPGLLATAPDALAVSTEPPGGSPAPTDVTLVGKVAG